MKSKITNLLAVAAALFVAHTASATITYNVDGVTVAFPTTGDSLVLDATSGGTVALSPGLGSDTEILNSFTFTAPQTSTGGTDTETISRNITIVVTSGTQTLTQSATVNVTKTTTSLGTTLTISPGSTISFSLPGNLLLTVTPLGFNGNTGITLPSKHGSTISGEIDGDFTLTSVPEPSTVVAGALLLLPFGFSAFRVFRKNAATPTV